ncbi:hypothetical protein [Sinomicrobium sp. M5D2P17]
MAKHLISLVLLILSAFLSFRNGWGALNVSKNPESVRLMTELGIKELYLPAMGIAIISIGALILFPKTFLPGNILNAISIVIIIALALNAGNYKMALIEIPFLALPLLLIWLKYPFKN